MIYSIVGLIASVMAILGGVIISARYLAHKFDKWTESVIDNSAAIRTLTDRVNRLEDTIGKQ